MSAPLETEYGIKFGSPLQALTLPMLMTLPRVSRRCGSAAW